MFTKHDYAGYFERIAVIERTMLYNVQNMIDRLGDAELKMTCEKIVLDEMRHYAYVRGIFESVIMRDEKDRRSFVREHVLGIVSLYIPSLDRHFDAYCLDVSHQGFCIESREDIPIGCDVVAGIEFFDGRPERDCSGTIVWQKTIVPELRVGSFHFRAGVRLDED